MENPFEQINTRLHSIEEILCRIDYSKIGQIGIPIMPLQIKEEDVTFDVPGLAKYLFCTNQTVHNLKKSGAIPYHKLGRLLYFLKSEVDNISRVEKIKKGVKK
jgi:hypothetical protein